MTGHANEEMSFRAAVSEVAVPLRRVRSLAQPSLPTRHTSQRGENLITFWAQQWPLPFSPGAPPAS
jgi:hypothetical protein